MTTLLRLTLPGRISCGAPELRTHRAAVRRDGADALLLVHHLSRVQPDHHPLLRRRGIALLLSADKRRMAEAAQKPTRIDTHA